MKNKKVAVLLKEAGGVELQVLWGAVTSAGEMEACRLTRSRRHTLTWK